MYLSGAGLGSSRSLFAMMIAGVVRAVAYFDRSIDRQLDIGPRRGGQFRMRSPGGLQLMMSIAMFGLASTRDKQPPGCGEGAIGKANRANCDMVAASA